MSASTVINSDTARKVAGRQEVFRSQQVWLLPAAGVFSILVVLEIFARSGMVNENYIPPVSSVLATLFESLLTSELWSAVWLTLQGWAAGLLIAALIGIPVGIACGVSKVVFHSLRPIVEFLRPVPSVALVPLAVIMFGAGMDSKIFLAAFASTWPILVHSMYGIRDLDPLQLDVAKSYRIGRVGTIVGVLVPGSLAHVATGLRIASAISLALVVSAEIIFGAPGIGELLNTARASGNVKLVFSLIVVAGALGAILNAIVRFIERRALSWHVSHREVAK